MQSMAIPREAIPQLSDRFSALLPHLNERQRRLALGVEARLLGHGGVGRPICSHQRRTLATAKAAVSWSMPTLTQP